MHVRVAVVFGERDEAQLGARLLPEIDVLDGRDRDGRHAVGNDDDEVFVLSDSHRFSKWNWMKVAGDLNGDDVFPKDVVRQNGCCGGNRAVRPEIQCVVAV